MLSADALPVSAVEETAFAALETGKATRETTKQMPRAAPLVTKAVKRGACKAAGGTKALWRKAKSKSTAKTKRQTKKAAARKTKMKSE